MPDWLLSIYTHTKEVSSKIAMPIFITLGIIIFLPEDYISLIGIADFRASYNTWIGFIFLLSAATILSNFIWWSSGKLKPWIMTEVLIRTNRKSLQNLTEDEKIILRRFINDGEAAVYEAINSGPINLLELKQVVIRPSTLAAHFTSFAYVLQPWARDYLLKNRHLLS